MKTWNILRLCITLISNRNRSKDSKDVLCKKWSISVWRKWCITIELSIIHIYVARFAQCRIFRAPHLARGFSPLAGSYTRHTRHRATRHMSRGWRCKSWKFKRDISFPDRPLISRDLERFAKLLLSRATDGWDMALRRTAVATFFRTKKILPCVTVDFCFIFFVWDNSVIDEIWILFHLSFIWFCVHCLTNRWNSYIKSW